ncbi:MAG: amino acid permease [Gammaproteobacteria bacterium]|nr:amino acid permease [Gammaproteobacteria bacterium]
MTNPVRYFARKPIKPTADQSLNRVMGPVHLVLIGIGCIVGAGVYVITGPAAAEYAGPAIMLSFVMAAFACGFTALCYAELASMMPVSGASYSYAYSALGEIFAWALGWMLLLEFWLAGSALAAGASGYLVSLLGDFGLQLPVWLTTATINAVRDGVHTSFSLTANFNLLAVIIVGAVCSVLVRGVSQSVVVNTIMVLIKVGVLILFVGVGFQHVDPTLWQPLVPANEGGFRFGIEGVFRAASILFFSYLGFEAVATAALEARNPKRDVPIGIIGALIISCLLYMGVALVLTGLVPFRELGVPDPIALAVGVIEQPVLNLVVKIGALTGLLSVLMVNTYGHSRICFAMAQDGLIPPVFKAVEPRFKTPLKGTVIVASLAAIAAALLPISILADLVSIGTTFVFATVAISVMALRSRQPELPRLFKVPLGGVKIGKLWLGTTPVCALLCCAVMVTPVFIDIFQRASRGDVIPLCILVVYLLIGFMIYFGYGVRRSVVQLSQT